MSKVIMSIGWILLALGVSCANSENLLTPTVLAFSGALLMYFGSKETIRK